MMFLGKLIKNSRGFSIIQSLALTGILGGIALLVGNISNDSRKLARTTAANAAVYQMASQINSNILNLSACFYTFGGFKIAKGQSIDVLQIKDKAGTKVIRTGFPYLNNQVSIEKMTFKRNDVDSSFIVLMNKKGIKDGKGIGGQHYRKVYAISAEWDGSNNLLACHSNENNSVDSAVKSAILEICPDGSDFPIKNGLVGFGEYPDIKCETLGQLDGLNCPSGEVLTGLIWRPSSGKYLPNCKKLASVPKCNLSQLIKRNADGSFICIEASCPHNGIFRGINSDGTSDCLSCPGGSVAVQGANGWDCNPISCSNEKSITGQQYFVGVDSNGKAICNQLIDNQNECSKGGRLIITSQGNLKYECCEPLCTEGKNYCIGTIYNSANNCGTCPGSKTPDCSDSGKYCEGISYSSGCGTCVGTKIKSSGIWSDWSGTSEYRPKIGAQCVSENSCGEGTIARERKYVRFCTPSICGGLGCVGLNEQWREEGVDVCDNGECNAGECSYDDRCLSNDPRCPPKPYCLCTGFDGLEVRQIMHCDSACSGYANQHSTRTGNTWNCSMFDPP